MRKCGSLSATKITSWDGELVTYSCSSETIDWADGCGHDGKISPFDGNAKFPWKVDWPAKFVAKNVHFEGGGKDHYSKGGARQVAEVISKEVFRHEPPYGVFNEFFLIGGKKMSSSKGSGATAVAMTELLPPHILRLLLLKTPINRQISFDPEGDSIPVLFDTYDRLAGKYWTGVNDDDTQLFYFTHLPAQRGDLKQERFLPRFSQVAFLVQMPHMNLQEEVSNMKGAPLTEEDKIELSQRATYAKKWLDEFAEEKFIFALQSELPPVTLSETESNALTKLAQKIQEQEKMTGESLHEQIHEVKELSGLTPKEFFSAIYRLFLGKDSGPKVGWFFKFAAQRICH